MKLQSQSIHPKRKRRIPDRPTLKPIITKSYKIRKSFKKAVIYIVLIFAAIIFLIPTLVAVNTAFKLPKEILEVLSLPSRVYFGNFIDGLKKIGRSFINSLMICFPAMVFSTFVGSLAAYPLAQFRFRGDTVIYFVLLSGMYIPFQTVLIPLFLIIRRLGLYDTIPGLWLAHIAYGIPFTTLILRNFFATIPVELMEAAKLDGCSLFRYYWRILLPVSRAGIAATLILQFRSIWNEFIMGLTLTRSSDKVPVMVQLQSFVSRTEVTWGPMMAATFISVLPAVIVFLVFKKQFVEGLAGTAKG